jgi:hypothetical protein
MRWYGESAAEEFFPIAPEGLSQHSGIDVCGLSRLFVSKRNRVYGLLTLP